MQQIVTIIGPTLFIIALGYMFGRIGRPTMAPLVNLTMYVATPCLVLGSVYSSPIVFSEAAKIWASCLLIMVGTFVIAWMVFGLAWKAHTVLYLPIVFMNTINIPLPIIKLAFGDEGIAQTMLFYIPYALLINSLAVCVASGGRGIKEGLGAILRTPLIYAVVVGLVLNLSGVALPKVITGSLDLMGQAAVPLMLLVLGMTVGEIRLTHLPATLVAGVIRVGFGFSFGLLAVWLFSFTDIPRAVILFEAAMPSAVFTSVLANRYKNEAELVSSVVLATTLMSLAVIPALLYYLT